MPEFVMLDSEAPLYRALDAFTQGYIEAMFFTDTEPGTDRETWDPETQSSLPGDVGFGDIAESALEKIKKDCAAFQKAHAALLDDATAYDYEMVQAGRDFWYSRNGHGTGFFDRFKEIPSEHLRDALQDAARDAGEVWSHFGDDGLVYIM